MLGLESPVGILKIHCTPPHTYAHPTHTHSWPEFNKSYEIRVNRKTAEEEDRRKKEGTRVR